ncbi:MAG: hypothetical protein JXR70_19045 [Spirochaetales bacterium]|nr:hypothetical protein [Spirochaetales bacterium]
MKATQETDIKTLETKKSGNPTKAVKDGKDEACFFKNKLKTMEPRFFHGPRGQSNSEVSLHTRAINAKPL